MYTPTFRSALRTAAAGLMATVVGCGGDSAAPLPPAAAQVQLTAAASALTAVGATTQLTARVIDDRGADMPSAQVTWRSDTPAVLQVSSSGLVTAVAAGVGTVTATAGQASGSIQLTVDQVATGLDLLSGAGQQGQVGQPLTQAIRFRVSDSNGNGAGGKPVQLTVTQGGGTVQGAGTTQADGTLDVVWTLGTNATQPQELTAALGNLSRAVTATAMPGPATAVQSFAGTDQTGLAGEQLADSVTALVVDAYGNAVANATVAWSVRAGGGTITPATASSGADGRSRARWVLGPRGGLHEVQGLVTGMAPALFMATALPNGIIEGVVTVSGQLLGPQIEFARSVSVNATGRRSLTDGPLGRGESALRAASAPHTPHAQPETVPGQWIVRLRDDVLAAPAQAAGFSMAAAQAVAADMRVQLAAVEPIADGRFTVEGVSPALGAARVSAAADDPTALARLRSDPRIAFIEPVYIYHTTGGSAVAMTDLPEERYFPRQSWHYGSISLLRAWEVTRGSPAVVVAVLDDGIRFDHPSIAPNLTADGYDFVSSLSVLRCNGGPIDESGKGGPGPDPTVPIRYDWSQNNCAVGPSVVAGHGLHVAGTIAASAGGLLGVAPNVRIRAVRVLGVTGRGSNYDIAQGILFAAGLPADNGWGGLVSTTRAPIINMSLGGASNSLLMANAVAQAASMGSLIIAAAGNSASSAPNYPAAYAETISVSALSPNFNLAPYSNYGATIDISAPGGNTSLGDIAGVWSSVWNFQTNTATLASYQGTSMAAPHVAGVAALALSRFPGTPAGQLRQLLIGTATDYGAPGWDPIYGYGVVDALAVVTGGAGLPSTLHVHLYNAATGAHVAQVTPGGDRFFRFPGLADASYYVFAGGDDRGDGVTGRPGFIWGGRGGSSTPSSVLIDGYGVNAGSFTAGAPTEREPNSTMQSANPLMIGGYVYGQIDATGDTDWFRIQVGQPRTVTIETGGWLGMCGFGYSFRIRYRLTCTRPISTGTSTSGPTTVAKATGEVMPNTAMATAMASSKLLPDAVNASVALRL
jgi:subtilisin family serine protease